MPKHKQVTKGGKRTQTSSTSGAVGTKKPKVKQLKSAYKDDRCVFCGGHECSDADPCKWRKAMVKGSDFPEEVLHRALRHVEDLLQRAAVPFLLLGKTATGIYHDESLAGLQEINVGVQSKYLTKEAMSTIKTLAGDISTPDGFGYVFDRIPIKIKVIRKDYSFLKNPDVVFYKAGEYNLPNPMSAYLKIKI